MRSIFFLALSLISISSFSQDLVFQEISGPEILFERGEVSHTFTIKNAGIVATAHTLATLWLSTDATFDYSDKSVGAMPIPAIAAGQSVQESLDYSRVLVSPGEYYLLLQLDYYGEVTETDEANNLVALPYTVASSDFDFSFSSFTLSASSVPVGDKLDVTVLASNTGATNAGGSIDLDFYFSLDEHYDIDDVPLRWYNRLDIVGPDIIDVTEGLTMPAAPLGQYYIIAILDRFAEYPETNENNNTLVRPIELTASDADLEITNAYVEPYLDDGLRVNLSMRNNGLNGIGDFPIRITLSNGINSYTLYSEHPVRNGGRGFWGDTFLAAGHSGFLAVELEFRSYTTPPPGHYDFEVVVNENYIQENNMSDNHFVGTVIIPGEPLKQIQFLSLYTNQSIDEADLGLSFTLGLQNRGTDENFTESYTFSILNGSLDEIYSQDIEVNIGEIGQVLEIPISVTLSQGLPVGNYTALISCIANCNSTVPYIGNNFSVRSEPKTLTGILKGEDGVLLNSGKLFLYRKDNSGQISFVDQVTPVSESNFSFEIDNVEHTLYYIPDPTVTPQYAPTIYGKTVLLQPSSFFSSSEDIALVFEILKIQPLASGEGVIRGTVSSGDNNQMSFSMASTQSLAAPEEPTPVILLSASGSVVGVAYTDVTGYFEFRNLPRAQYGLLVSQALDESLMDEPFPIDLTTKNVSVEFVGNGSSFEPTASALLFDQTIDFASLPLLKYGELPPTLHATANSGLPVVILSSDNSIAEIVDSKLIIKKTGTVILTARQDGNNFYHASEVTREVTIAKGVQTLTMNDLARRRFGDASFVPVVVSSANLNIALISSDPAIAAIVDGAIQILKPGEVTITATQPGNEFFNGASTSRTLVIDKGIQTLTFGTIPTKTFGDAAFSVPVHSSSGLAPALKVSDERVAVIAFGYVVLRGAGVVTLTATHPGNAYYEAATDVSITLTVEKASQTITFAELESKTLGDEPFALTASSSSGLPIKFSVETPTLAAIQNNVVTLIGAGTVKITASQEGDQNFHAASPLSRIFEVDQVLGLEDTATEVSVYPNPVQNFLVVEGVSTNANLVLLDVNGRTLSKAVTAMRPIDFQGLSSGVYFLVIHDGLQRQIIRIMKQ